MKSLGLFLAGLIATLLLAELVLRVLPVPAGLFAADPAADWPIHRMVPNTDITQSFGWDLQNVHRAHINNRGYAASFDYRDGPVGGIVIGDSFVEGLSNAEPERLQSYLAHDLNLPAHAIYSFGTSGASLPHYLGTAELAGKHYRPGFAVILIVDRDFSEGFDSLPGFYNWGKAPALIALTPELRRGTLSKVARDLAINRYVRANLKFSPATLFSSGLENAPKPTCRTATLSPDDQRLLQGWLDRIGPAFNLPANRIVLVFDSDRQSLYSPHKPARACPSREILAQRRLRDGASAHGYRVVDTAPIFAADWAANLQPLDRSPLDAHWTPRANELVAVAVARALTGRK